MCSHTTCVEVRRSGEGRDRAYKTHELGTVVSTAFMNGSSQLVVSMSAGGGGGGGGGDKEGIKGVEGWQEGTRG